MSRMIIAMARAKEKKSAQLIRFFLLLFAFIYVRTYNTFIFSNSTRNVSFQATVTSCHLRERAYKLLHYIAIISIIYLQMQ